MTKIEREYAEAHGEDALERQRAEARRRHWCCAENVDGPHHPVCSNAEPLPAAPEVHETQETLI
jgi:hypothetical protein